MFTIFWRKIFLKNGNKKRVSVKTCLRMQVDPVNSCCLCLVWVKFWSQLSWSSEFSIFFYVSSLSIRIMELLTPDILLSCQKLYMLSFQIHVQSCFKNFIHTEVVGCVCVCVCVCVNSLENMPKSMSSLPPNVHTNAFKQKWAYSLRGFVIFLNLV